MSNICYTHAIKSKGEPEMTAMEIIGFAPINDVDAEKVAEIAANIKANGWKGAPVLVMASMAQMVTGSHRLAALQMIDAEANQAVIDGDYDAADALDAILNADVAVEVDDIVNDYCEAEECGFDEIPFDNLSAVFAGTDIEQYAAELVEW